MTIYQLQGDDEARLTALNEPAHSSRDGTAGDTTAYYRVSDAQWLADGRIAVANRGNSQIVLLDSTGARLSAIGRKGRGPGEFVSLQSMVVLADDTLAVLDRRTRRISLSTAAGEFVRDFGIQAPEQAATAGQAAAVGAIANDALVIWLQIMPSTEEIARLNQINTVGQIPVVLFVVDAAGGLKSTIGVFPGLEMWIGGKTLPSGEQVSATPGPAPFGNWTGFGVHDGRIHVFRGAEAEFRVYSPQGDLLSIHRGTWPVRPVTADDRNLHMREWLKPFTGALADDPRRKDLEKIRYPETMPAYRDAVVGTDGIVWIEPYADWNGERHLYVGYDATGLAIGKLTFGYDDRILEIGHGRAILLHVSDDGVETIRPARYSF